MIDITEFEAFLIGRGCANSTVRDSVSKVKQLLKKYGGISSEMLDKFVVEKRREGKANNGINAYLKAAKRWGQFKNDEKISQKKLLPKNDSAIETFTADELSRFLSVKDPLSNKAKINHWLFFNLGGLTGLRLSEVARLKVQNINFADSSIKVISKTGRIKTNHIPHQLIQPLAEHCNSIKNEYLFPSDGKNEKHVNPGIWGPAFHYRLKMLGINRKGLRPNSLRHTYITTQLRVPGNNLFDGMGIWGHTNPQSTMRYYHQDVERKRAIMERHPYLMQNASEEDRAKFVIDFILSLGMNYWPKYEKESGLVMVDIRGSPKREAPSASREAKDNNETSLNCL